jgi:lipopolysaccharide export system protein LptC
MAREVRSWLDRATAWSPVLLLGGLAALTYWLDSQVQVPVPRQDGSARHDPDLFVQGFRAVTLDAQGRPIQAVAGTLARHFGDDQTTEVTDPMLAQTEAGKPAFRVTAARGKLSGDRKEVTFTGNVRAVREAGPTTPGESPAGPVTVTTEYLHVIPDQEIARTDKPVTIEEPRGIIHSVGLDLDNKAKTLKLRSGVRGTLQPQALPK